MNRRFLGVETEYAVNATSSGAVVDRALVVSRLMRLAQRRFCHLADQGSSGFFLENGARFYVDGGQHIEYSTPECDNPWDALRYVEAGHRTMQALLQEFAGTAGRGEEACGYRANVDYEGNTWGCHESYLHEAPASCFPAQLLPHLVSRLIFTGAGGFAPSSRGLQFTLSPRAWYIQRAVAGDSAGVRGIFHTRDEPLCRDYRRLHVLCGESLCSHLGTLVKLGSTALVVAMADAGVRPGDAVQIAWPVAALRIVATDVTCRKTLRLQGGGRMSALAIQRHYLGMAESHLDDSYMPEWAPELCVQWRRVLDLLARGPAAARQVLDWPLKMALYSRHAAACGVAWERLPFWKDLLERMGAEFQVDPDGPFPLESCLNPESPRRDALSVFEGEVNARGTSWDELRQLLARRAEFLELDIRFSELGARGVFSMLDAAGVLDHRVAGAESIDEAMRQAPASGRALLRGGLVKRLAEDKDGEWICSWEHVLSRERDRYCDLSDPFATEEVWREGMPTALSSLGYDLSEGPF